MASEPSAAYLAEDRSQPALIGIVVVTALSAVVVIVRLYARRVLVRGLGWDDLFIVLAQVRLNHTLGTSSHAGSSC